MFKDNAFRPNSQKKTTNPTVKHTDKKFLTSNNFMVAAQEDDKIIIGYSQLTET